MPYNQSIDLKLKQLGVRVHLLRKGCFYFIFGGSRVHLFIYLVFCDHFVGSWGSLLFWFILG